MRKFAIYNINSGRIYRFYSGIDSEAIDQCDENEHCINCPDGTGISGRTHYVNVDNGEIEERPETPYTVDKTEIPADGASAVTLSDLEPGTSAAIRGPATDQWTVDDGTDEITFSTAGQYKLAIQAPFPAKELEITIHAT